MLFKQRYKYDLLIELLSEKVQRISHRIIQRMGDNEDVVNLSLKVTEPIVRA